MEQACLDGRKDYPENSTVHFDDKSNKDSSSSLGEIGNEWWWVKSRSKFLDEEVEGAPETGKLGKYKTSKWNKHSPKKNIREYRQTISRSKRSRGSSL